MSQQQNFVSKRKPNALAEYKLRLIGKPVGGAGRAPTLSMVVVKNQPHIVVRTNVENDKNYGKIEAKLDTLTFFALIEEIERIAAGPNGTRTAISNMGHPFTNGQRSKEAKLDTRITVGKTGEGVVWIAVTSWEQGRPVIQFSFTPSQYHNWANADGTPLTEAEVSTRYAKAFTHSMSQLVPFILYSEHVEPEQRNQGGGGGGQGGGGNWNNNNSGGGNNQGRNDNEYGSGGGGGLDDSLPL